MNLKIDAELREAGPKSQKKQLRLNGKIPAVIYGEGKPGIMITVDEKEFTKTYKKGIGEVAFFDITLDGKQYRTVIKEKQIHPVKRNTVHVDFMELHAGKPLTLDIPIKFEGEPVGVKTGGVLEIGLRFISVSCLPKDIKDDIVVDISGLEVGDSIHLSELDLGVMESKTNLESLVASVHTKRGTKSEDEEGEETEEGTEEGTEEAAAE